MKKRIIALVLAVLATVSLVACTSASKKLAVKETRIDMKVGDKHQVELLKNVENVKWESRDEDIATVSQKGEITAVAEGITVITAMTDDSYVHIGLDIEGGGGYVDKNGKLIRVFDGDSDITEVEVGIKGSSAKGDVTIKVGEKQTLRAITTPSDSKDEIVWVSDNPSVAAVDEKGVLKGVSKGKTEIVGYAPNGVNGTMIVRVK